MSRTATPDRVANTTLPRVVALLALILIAHQFVMATPLHDEMMPMVSAMGHSSAVSQCDENASSPLHTIAICPAVQAALPAATAFFLLMAGIIVVALSLAIPRLASFTIPDWRPPPRQTLVLFQIFRC